MIVLSQEAAALNSLIRRVRDQLEQCGSSAVMTPSMGLEILNILDAIHVRIASIEAKIAR